MALRSSGPGNPRDHGNESGSMGERTEDEGGEEWRGKLPGSCEPLLSYTLTASSANIRSMCAAISSPPPLSIRTNSRAVR